MPQVYGYCRISVVKKGKGNHRVDDGDSVEVQKRALETQAAMAGVTLAGIYADVGVSGAVPFCDRPEGKKLLSVLKPGDQIWCTKGDRFSRETSDAIGTMRALSAAGIELHLLDQGGKVKQSATAKAFFGMSAVMSSFERDRIRERVIESRAYLREQSRFLGGDVPLGFVKRLDPVTEHLDPKRHRYFLEPDEHVQGLAKTLKEQRYSASMAAGHLRAQGIQATHVSVGRLWRTLAL